MITYLVLGIILLLAVSVDGLREAYKNVVQLEVRIPVHQRSYQVRVRS